MALDFHLLKDVKIEKEIPANVIWAEIHVNLKPQNVFPVDAQDSSWQVCNELRAGLRNQEVERKIILAFYISSPNDLSINLHGPYIKHLVDKLGTQITCAVTLTDFYGAGLPGPFGSRTVNCRGMRLVKRNTNSSVPMFSACLNDERGRTVRADLGGTLSGVISVRITAPVVANPAGDANSSPPSGENGGFALSLNKRILSEQFETDTELVASNGVKIGCHKLFLTGNSPVFQRMLQSQAFVEAQSKTVVLDDMSEVGVRSLLSFLYYGDVEKAGEDFDVCLELLEASEKYGIKSLQERMKNLFLAKEMSWFNVEGGLRLFCFARNLEDLQGLKLLAAQFLKLKFVEVKASEAFQQLFQEDSEAAKDLCCMMISLCC